jgi:hypothetical protein
VLVLLCGGFSVGIFALVTGILRQSEVYQQALAEVRASPAVEQELGDPIEPGWWVTGSLSTSGDSGEANITFPVVGPRGEARVFVEATRRARRWQSQLLQVELPSGDRIDLLEQEGEGPFDVVSVFLARCSRGEYAGAHELFAEGLKEVQPLAEFGPGMAEAQRLCRTSEIRLERSPSARGTRLEGTLLGRDGRVAEAAFGLIRERGSWRIVEYHLEAADAEP